MPTFEHVQACSASDLTPVVPPRAQLLFRDQWIGVVRMGHPLSEGEITRTRYALGRHIMISRRGLEESPIDDALMPLDLKRDIATIVAGFSTALALARSSDLIATVPERHTAGLRFGLQSFALPVTRPIIPLSLLWHSRLDTDPAHRWLRECSREVCAE